MKMSIHSENTLVSEERKREWMNERGMIFLLETLKNLSIQRSTRESLFYMSCTASTVSGLEVVDGVTKDSVGARASANFYLPRGSLPTFTFFIVSKLQFLTTLPMIL